MKELLGLSPAGYMAMKAVFMLLSVYWIQILGKNRIRLYGRITGSGIPSGQSGSISASHIYRLFCFFGWLLAWLLLLSSGYDLLMMTDLFGCPAQRYRF